MPKTVYRAASAALMLAGIALATPAAAESQCKPDESKGRCCMYDEVLKRDVYASCGRIKRIRLMPAPVPAPVPVPVPQRVPQAVLPSAPAPAMSLPAAAAPDLVGAPAADAPDQTEALGNPGNDKAVGRAGETPGNNEPGSFGDGVKGRSDVADGGGATGGGSRNGGAGSGASGNNGKGNGSAGNGNGKGGGNGNGGSNGGGNGGGRGRN